MTKTIDNLTWEQILGVTDWKDYAMSLPNPTYVKSLEDKIAELKGEIIYLRESVGSLEGDIEDLEYELEKCKDGKD